MVDQGGKHDDEHGHFGKRRHVRIPPGMRAAKAIQYLYLIPRPMWMMVATLKSTKKAMHAGSEGV
jgi:hypothetical protein